jgi:hypothetical protein
MLLTQDELLVIAFDSAYAAVSAVTPPGPLRPIGHPDMMARFAVAPYGQLGVAVRVRTRIGSPLRTSLRAPSCTICRLRAVRSGASVVAVAGGRS